MTFNNTNKPYFRFGLRGNSDSSRLLLSDYPLAARNSKIKTSQELAVNAVLSNIITGNILSVRNFGDLKSGERGFSRVIFLQVLNHLCDYGLLIREGKDYSRSVIKFLPRIMRYRPQNIVNYPESTIFTNAEGEGRKVVKINTDERRELNNRLKAWWQFIKQHEIDPGITTNDFKLFNDRETLVFGKPLLTKPQRTDILPCIIYNDRNLTMGGFSIRCMMAIITQ